MDAVVADVYNLSGAKVASLYEGKVIGGQNYSLIFDGANLPDGIYIYRITTSEKSYYNKLILMK